MMKTGICLLIMAIGISPVLWSATDTEKHRQLAEIQSKIQQVDADVRHLSTERAAQIEQLKKLEMQYGELANALIGIKADIKQQEQVLQGVRHKVSATQKDIHTQQNNLEGLIKSAYATGGQEGLKVILNQRDPSLSGRMLVYHDYISKARLQKLQLIQEDLKTLRQLEAEKDTESQLLQIAMDKKQQETDAMQALKNQREKLLTQIDSDYASKRDQLERLIHDEKKLEALVASLQKTDDNEVRDPLPTRETNRIIHQRQPAQPEQESPRTQEKSVESPRKAFADLQGLLPWPVQGSIVERFGSRRFETSWDGTVIGAREGAEIHAVAPGRVVFADWLRGYGLMMIVDHGKGYMSLYAFNQSLHKSVGDQVRTGDTLASVGRSGGRSQAALYFGIRKKGKPLDPEQWCRKPTKG
ncbi:MAG: murein hydrolase activator EnvC family protein [Methylomonas sp.]